MSEVIVNKHQFFYGISYNQFALNTHLRKRMSIRPIRSRQLS